MPTLSELKTLYAGLLGQPVEAFERDFWREGDHPRVAGEVNVQTASGQWVNLQSACNRENGVPIWIDGWIWSSDVRPPDAANLYFHNGRIAWDAQSFRDRSVRALPVRALASTIAHAALNHPPSRRPP
jgi:hypothetical protein